VRPRKRVDQACTECSKRHRRCEKDVGAAKCKRCTKHDTECIFGSAAESPTSPNYPDSPQESPRPLHHGEDSRSPGDQASRPSHGQGGSGSAARYAGQLPATSRPGSGVPDMRHQSGQPQPPYAQWAGNTGTSTAGYPSSNYPYSPTAGQGPRVSSDPARSMANAPTQGRPDQPPNYNLYETTGGRRSGPSFPNREWSQTSQYQPPGAVGGMPLNPGAATGLPPGSREPMPYSPNTYYTPNTQPYPGYPQAPGSAYGGSNFHNSSTGAQPGPYNDGNNYRWQPQ